MLKQITSYPLNRKIENKVYEMRYIDNGVIKVVEGDIVSLNLFIKRNNDILVTHIGYPKITFKAYEKKIEEFSLI